MIVSHRADDTIWPYELVRIKFLAVIMIKARMIKELNSWKIKQNYLKNLILLANIIDNNDAYTRGHCNKVMKYSLLISHKLGLPTKELKIIKTAGILHDIGKIGIDLKILRKPAKLDEADWAKIKIHPEIGAKIVRQSGCLDEAVSIVMHHHARYAGGGYPDPDIYGADIPLGARIISVADSFDAMTSNRPYRKAMPKETAMEELKRCAGQQFDPIVVRAFVNVK